MVEEKKLEELAKELSKGLKTEKDLSTLSRALLKLSVEAALGAEMEEHLGYEPYAAKGRNSGNNRNGHSRKRLKGDFGEIEIKTPRDRIGAFEPQLIKKGQTRFTEFDDQILSLYARGMTTRDIAAAFREMYGAEVSHTLISRVTDAVIDEVHAWQESPLDALYPILYLDGIVVKVHQDKRVINKTIYLALGINAGGQKTLLGLWLSENEGSKFWLSVLTELKNRGLKDIFIACVDGLTGFPDAIQTVYPQAKVQLCIVHMVRNSLRYVASKHMKEVASDLRTIYKSLTADAAKRALEEFAEKWDTFYPSISKSWRSHWEHLITIFDYPDEIRRVIYTTNAIESLNSVIRKAIRNRKIFPHDDSAMKVVYLAVTKASEKWTMPIRNWKPALNRFAIEFDDRFQLV